MQSYHEIPIPMLPPPARYSFRKAAPRAESSNVLFLVVIAVLVGGIGFLSMMLVRPDHTRGPSMHAAMEPPPKVEPAIAVPPVAPPPVTSSAAVDERPAVTAPAPKAAIAKKKAKRAGAKPVQMN